MENMKKEIIEIFRNKINVKIKQLDCIIQYYMNNFNEEKISSYVDEKLIWNWCLDILTETEADVYNNERKGE